MYVGVYITGYLESLQHKSTLAVGHVGVHICAKRFVQEVELDVATHLRPSAVAVAVRWVS